MAYDDAPKSWRERRDLLRLELRNRFAWSSLVDGDSDAVVSLTTHGPRLSRAHVALESVGRGTVRPRRLILWLDDRSRVSELPASIRRLMRRGLEVRFVDPGLGVHTKYWPYVSATAEAEDRPPLCVCDDDIVYPQQWLADLLAASRRHPDCIVAFRTHAISAENGHIAPYRSWTPTRSASPSFAHFPTAVSGTLYPQAVHDEALRAGTAFLQKSPKNDDIWLFALAVNAGIRCVQVTDEPRHFPFVPGTQSTGLYLENVVAGLNDPQLAASLTPLARQRVVDDAQGREGGSPANLRDAS